MGIIVIAREFGRGVTGEDVSQFRVNGNIKPLVENHEQRRRDIAIEAKRDSIAILEAVLRRDLFWKPMAGGFHLS